MGKRLLDGLSIAAVLVVMVIIIYASSALIDGRFYEEDVQTTWDEIAETFPRWEYARQAREQEITGSVESSEEADRLVIGNVSGAVQVERWDEPFILISYDRSSLRDDHLDDVYVEIRERNNQFEAATQFRPNIPSAVGSVGFEVYVPKSIKSVRVNTITGSVDLLDIPEHTNVEVSMVSSAVHVEGGRSLRVHGGNGSIDFLTYGGSINIDAYSSPVRGAFRMMQEDQHIAIRTGSGDIDMLFPAELYDIEYSVRTKEGKIALSPTLNEMRDEGVEGEVKGVLGEAKRSVSLQTETGDITLRLAGDEGQLKSIDLLRTTDDLMLFEFLEDAFNLRELEALPGDD